MTKKVETTEREAEAVLGNDEGKKALERSREIERTTDTCRQYYSSEVSAMIEGEKYDHQAYIYGYFKEQWMNNEI